MAALTAADRQSQRWHKQGRLFTPTHNFSWMTSHAQLPTVDTEHGDYWRVYYSSRNSLGQSQISFFDVAANKPSEVVNIHPKCVLEPGTPGAFDDAGVMPGCIITVGSDKWLFYTGWSLRSKVPYQTETGVAFSSDGGRTFRREYEGPLFGRTLREPYINGSPFVLRDTDGWWCWYFTGTKWQHINGRWESIYRIVSARSENGLEWQRQNDVAVDYKSEAEGGVTRGTVVRNIDGFNMWFSYRGAADFRAGGEAAYRIGYAHSADGKNWARHDEKAGIDLSEDDAWDSEMIAYPYVFEAEGKTHMFYNGNGFGQSGIGRAVLEPG